MVVEFKLPDPGEGIHEGNLVKWRIKEGDEVKEHDVIADLETDKAVIEIPSPVSGKIKELKFKAGDTIKVGDVIVVIDDGSGGEASEEKKEEFKDRSIAVVGELEIAGDNDEEEFTPKKPTSKPVSDVKILPMTRKIAEDMNVDLTKVKGSGPDGMITERDIKKSALLQSAGMNSEQLQSTPTPASSFEHPDYEKYGTIEKIEVKSIRKATAEHMTLSEHTAAHVSHFEDIDVTELSNYRDSVKEEAKARGVKLTFLPFIVKAVIKALKEHPYVNASMIDAKKEIVLKKYYNIGIAVDTPEGLLVPNIKNANTKSIDDIAKEIVEMANKGKERKLSLDEMRGGTFTITNIGALGGTYATPIINYPESAILGLGMIKETPVVKNGEIVIAKILPISLSFDHKILDGAEAARFANSIKKYLENYKEIIEEQQDEATKTSSTPHKIPEDVLDGIL